MIKEMQRTSQNRKALLMFLSGITILPFGPEAAQAYGEIRHTLQSQGQLIGANDLLVAAHAKTAGLILVTHNTREYCKRLFFIASSFFTNKNSSAIFVTSAMKAIARKAVEIHIGARGLRTVLGQVLYPILFNIDGKYENHTITINRDTVNAGKPPVIEPLTVYDMPVNVKRRNKKSQS